MEPKTESLVIAPEISGGLEIYNRNYSESPLKGGVSITDIVVPQPETTTQNQVASLSDVTPPVSVAAPITQQKQPDRTLELAAFPQPIERGAPAPKKEPSAAVVARRERGETTPAER